MTPEIEKILAVTCSVYRRFKIAVVITSGIDGPHRENSLHYKFRAIDIRKNFPNAFDSSGWQLHRAAILDMMEETFQRLKYPVLIVVEQDHIHLEWCGE